MLWLPSVIFPKSLRVGLAVTWGGPPVPESETVAGELVALLAIEMPPVTWPVAVGANVALKVALWPTVKVIGKARPVTLKPAPVTVACETMTLPVPVLLSVTV